jgi:hypothetical protein
MQCDQNVSSIYIFSYLIIFTSFLRNLLMNGPNKLVLHYTMLERLDKQPSLLGQFVSDEENEVL